MKPGKGRERKNKGRASAAKSPICCCCMFLYVSSRGRSRRVTGFEPVAQGVIENRCLRPDRKPVRQDSGNGSGNVPLLFRLSYTLARSRDQFGQGDGGAIVFTFGLDNALPSARTGIVSTTSLFIYRYSLLFSLFGFQSRSPSRNRFEIALNDRRPPSAGLRVSATGRITMPSRSL